MCRRRWKSCDCVPCHAFSARPGHPAQTPLLTCCVVDIQWCELRFLLPFLPQKLASLWPLPRQDLEGSVPECLKGASSQFIQTDRPEDGKVRQAFVLTRQSKHFVTTPPCLRSIRCNYDRRGSLEFGNEVCLYVQTPCLVADKGCPTKALRRTEVLRVKSGYTSGRWSVGSSVKMSGSPLRHRRI